MELVSMKRVKEIFTTERTEDTEERKRAECKE
jgi:hypothetical protein